MRLELQPTGMPPRTFQCLECERHVVQSRWIRQASQSASVRRAKKMRQARSKSERAWSKLNAELARWTGQRVLNIA
jgi:hypothetical protein